ncbi:MAG: acyl-CoA desaturase [Pseudomonadota bacterium]
MSSSYQNPRLDHNRQDGCAVQGTVTLDPAKATWIGAMALGSMLAVGHASPGAVVLFALFTAVTLCLGHSIGMHRRSIHRSFRCPTWFEYLCVHLGTLVGLGGPLGMLRTHDTRDWAQRQPTCHPYFSHQAIWYQDLYWQLFCSIQLFRTPVIETEGEIEQDPVYRWMERYWMWQQLPWALTFFVVGGWPWVFWGICVRVLVGVVGHWLIGYFAHNSGQRDWDVTNAAVQGHNIAWVSLLTMGECWHNNHHAFPGSAKLGLKSGQWDPGWWVLRGLHRIGLAADFVLPAELPARKDLVPLEQNRRSKTPVGGCDAGR